MIQTVVPVFCQGFGNYFWQRVYNSSGSLIGTCTTTIDGSNNGLTANSSYLYFGGAEGVAVSILSVVPEPSVFASLALAACPGLNFRRRQRA
jgi:hypothetical protein